MGTSVGAGFGCVWQAARSSASQHTTITPTGSMRVPRWNSALKDFQKLLRFRRRGASKCHLLAPHLTFAQEQGCLVPAIPFYGAIASFSYAQLSAFTGASAT